MAADSFGTNPLQALDVNRDGQVTEVDALQVINAINFAGNDSADPADSFGSFIDVSGDGRGTALDALRVINALNFESPIVAATIVNDSAAANRADLALDLITNQYAMDLHISVAGLGDRDVQIRIGQDRDFVDITSRFSDRAVRLSEADLDSIFGEPLPDGDHPITVKIGDEGNSIEFVLTIDRQGPSVSPTGGRFLGRADDVLEVGFNEPVANPGAGIDGYEIRIVGGEPVAVNDRKVDEQGDLIFNLAERLSNNRFELNTAAGVTDLAGNPIAIASSLFEVADPVGIAMLTPDGSNPSVSPTSDLVVRFESTIDPATVTNRSIYVNAAGERVPGQAVVSENGRSVRWTPSDPLPSAVALQWVIDGDRLFDSEGTPIDADGDDRPGGVRRTPISIANLSTVSGTVVMGRIYEATVSADSTNSPIVGATVRVIGADGVSAVTDDDGRFRLSDAPGDEFFVRIETAAGDFFAPPLLVRPLLGESVGLEINGEPYDIFLPALEDFDTVDISASEPTRLRLGPGAIDDLEQAFPSIDRSEWTKLAFDFPIDALENLQDSPANSIGMVAMLPSRAPAPLPDSVDPVIVLAVTTSSPSRNAVSTRLTFPNLDDLDPGQSRPIWAYQNESGTWELIGRAVVSDDGETILSDPINVPSNGMIAVAREDRQRVTLQPRSILSDGLDPAVNEVLFQLAAIEQSLADTQTQFAEALLANIATAIPDSEPLDEADVVQILNDFDSIFQDDSSSQDLVGDLSARYDALIAGLLQRGEATESELQTLETIRDGLRTAVMIGRQLIQDYVDDVESRLADLPIESVSKADTIDQLKRTLSEATLELTARQIANQGASEIQTSERLNRIAVQLQRFDLESSLDADFRTQLALIDSIDESAGTISALVEGLRGLDGGRLGEGERFEGESGPGPEGESNFAQLVELGLDAIVPFRFVTTPERPNLIFESYLGLVNRRFEIRLNEFQQLANSIFTPVPAASYRIAGGQRWFASGKLGPTGTIDVALPPNRIFDVFLYEPNGDLRSSTRLMTPNGFASRTTVLFDARGPGGIDSDGDQLVDFVEQVFGTDPLSADTDGDGILDGAEVDQELSPLSRQSIPEGLVATVRPLGEVVDVVTRFSQATRNRSIGFLATGTYGLATVDLQAVLRPRLLGQIPLPGTMLSIATNDEGTRAYVAAGDEGLHVVDVSDAFFPRRLFTVTDAGRVDRVEWFDGVVVAAGDSLSLLDPSTGTVLQDVSLDGDSSRLLDVQRRGKELFALTGAGRFHALTRVGNSVVPLSSVSLPTNFFIDGAAAFPRLFAGDDVAYVSNGVDETASGNSQGGYATINIANPSELSFVTGVAANTGTSQPRSNLQTVINGSGLALVAGGRSLGLQLQSATDPNNTFSPIRNFPTPGSAQAVDAFGSFALVADGSEGLQIISYQPVDRAGIAPTADIQINAVDVDALTDGLQLVRGSQIQVSASAIDDVQTRHVELVINGITRARDTVFPFDFETTVRSFETLTNFSIPRPASEALMRVRVRSTDMAGNVRLSDEIVIEAVQDAFAPEVNRFSVQAIDIDDTRDGLQIYSGTQPILIFDTLDRGGDVRSVTLMVNGQTVDQSSSRYGTFRYTVAPVATGQSERTDEIRISVVDFEGNTILSDPISWNVVPDQVPPTLFASNVLTADADPGVGGRQFIAGQDVRFSYQASDDVAIGRVELLIDGNVVDQADSAAGELIWGSSVLRTGQTERVHEAILRVTDRAGNAIDGNPIEIIAISSGTPSVRTAGGDILQIGLNTLTIDFGQPIDPLSLDAGMFMLVGPSGIIAAERPIVLSDDQRTGTLTYNVTDQGSYQFNASLNEMRSELGVPLGDDALVASLSVAETSTRLFPSFVTPIHANSRILDIADLNRDGRDDVVVFTLRPNEVVVYFGQEGASFTQGESFTYLAGQTPRRLADLNGDGFEDVISTGFGLEPTYLPGRGDGTFGESIELDLPGRFFYELADYDGDGSIELLTSSSGSDEPFAVISISGDSEVTVIASGTSDSFRFNPIAVGDVNGDGINDLFGGLSFSGRYAVALGTSDGGFDDFVELTTDRFLDATLVDDFNNDGRVDLVDANRSNGELSIRFGQTDGAFTSPVVVAENQHFARLTSTDFDRDGNSDLINFNLNNDSVGLFLGRGDGTFESPVVTRVVSNLFVEPLLGDFNRDGVPDFVRSYGSPAGIQLVLGQSDGTFDTLVQPALVFPNATRMGDLNGDNRLDAIHTFSERNRVGVSLGNGDGSFEQLVYYSAGTSPGQLELADLNGDGRLDVVVENMFSGDFSVLMGTDTGTLASEQRYASESQSSGFQLVDFDEDGTLDIVSANNSGGLAVFSGRGNGTFGLAQDVYVNTFNFFDIFQLGNMDSVPGLDLVTLQRFSFDEQPLEVHLLDVDFRDYPGEPFSLPVDESTEGMQLIDLNSDSLDDIVSWNNSRASIYLNQDNGDFAEAVVVPFVGERFGPLLLEDLDSDGVVDLIYESFSGVIVHPGLGAGTFDAGQENFILGLFGIGDLTGDGRNELVVHGFDEPLSTYLVDENSNLTEGPSSPFDNDLVDAVIEDFGNDGVTDYATADFANRRVSVSAGTGGGSFAAPVHYPLDFTPRSVDIGDFNGDGLVDLLASDRFSDNAAILRGQPGGQFADAEDLSLSSFLRDLAVGDFDGDNRSDVVVFNTRTTALIFNANEDGQLIQGRTVNVGPEDSDSSSTSTRTIRTADVNGDGIDDLLIANGTGDDVSVVLSVRNPADASQISFDNPIRYAGGTSPQSFIVGDVDHDGDTDLVVGGFRLEDSTHTIVVLVNDGNGGFDDLTTYEVPFAYTSGLQLADLNRDGGLELFSIDRDIAFILEFEEDGTTSLIESFFVDTNLVTLGDLNDDGSLDLLGISRSVPDPVIVFAN